MDTDSYIEAVSGLIDVPLEAAWMLGIATFLELAAEMAAILDTVDLDDAELSLAPVYTPPDPEAGAGG